MFSHRGGDFQFYCAAPGKGSAFGQIEGDIYDFFATGQGATLKKNGVHGGGEIFFWCGLASQISIPIRNAVWQLFSLRPPYLEERCAICGRLWFASKLRPGSLPRF